MNTESRRLRTQGKGWCARLWARDRGQALALTAAGLFVILGFAGLAIDMGALRHERRLQQTAADAAAIAGANQLQYNVGVSGITSAAQDASKLNNFTDGACNPAPYCVTVSVNNPPSSPDPFHSGNANYVEAIVSAVHPTYFTKIFGVTQATVSARAVATLVSQKGGPTQGCVYSLGNTSYCTGNDCGISFSGTGTIVSASTCGFFDNGNLTTNGNPTVNVGTVAVTGPNNGNVICPDSSSSSCVSSSAPPTKDPLASLTPPTSCTPIPAAALQGSDSIQVNNSQVVSFPAGTYCAKNFTVNGGATVCNSTNVDCSGMPGSANGGVTFYITGTVNINGGATVQLTAPNSGTYAGILFYQDPTDNKTASLNGTSNSFYQGALYFPSAELDFGGTSSASMNNMGAAYTVIVANNVVIAGNPTLSIKSNYSSLPNGTFIFESAVLVE
jgi:hypothetical protein